MLTGSRLRQVAVVAEDCAGIAGQLRHRFGWDEPFVDPGVGAFGLTNAVFAAGDTFVEVVGPVQPGTTAGRYLARRGGDSGYMAIFQVPDLTVARQRLGRAGVRVVWTADQPDMAGTHLHPKDVPGAIVSLDWADPPGSWRWAGPAWAGRVPAHATGGIVGLTIEVLDPPGAARRWASVLGVDAAVDGDAASVPLPAANQRLRFLPVISGRGEGITEVAIAGLAEGGADIGGVRFVSERT